MPAVEPRICEQRERGGPRLLVKGDDTTGLASGGNNWSPPA